MKRCLPLFLLCFPLFASFWECDYCWHAEGGFDALYWKPSTPSFEYAQKTKDQLLLTPNYGWGFRIFASVSDRNRCNVVSLDFTQLQTTSTIKISSIPVKARERVRYNKVSLRVSRKLGGLYGYIGGRYVEILDKRMIFSSINTVYQAKLQAGGVEAGVWGHVPIWCGFGARGRLTLFNVIGDTYSDTFTSGVRSHSNPSRTRCVSGYEFRVGIDYNYCCNCFSFALEIGYEFDQYIDALTIRKSDINREANFGFGGPYASLTLGF